MITSIAKRGATVLRGIADALDPKPVVSNDYSIHVKQSIPLTEEAKAARAKRMQDLQTMVTSARW